MTYFSRKKDDPGTEKTAGIRFLCRLFWFFWTFWIFLLTVPLCASGETLLLDYSASQEKYAESVAAAVPGKTVVSQNLRGALQPVVVLCRTRGAEIDFAAYDPEKVIKGPRVTFTCFFSSLSSALRFISDLSGREDILYAELDQEVFQNAQNETAFHSWGAEEMGFRAMVSFAEKVSCRDVTVAVIDSGVYGHSLLSGRILKQGFDYVDQDYDSSNDGTGHGTHVAGIIADCTPGLPVSILPIRVLDNNGNGQISNVINAIREAVSSGASVINLSLASWSHSEALHCEILDALGAGVTVVIAAGNQGTDVSEVCPGHIQASGVITVGSVEMDGTVSSYSNYGSGVDVYAYGTEIVSCSRAGGFTAQSGTSMAAPHISAAAAILYGTHGGISPSAVESNIRQTAQARVPDLRGLVPSEMPLSLRNIRMTVGQEVPIPGSPLPETCTEEIRWASSAEEIAAAEEGRLKALSVGTAEISVSCAGLENQTFQVTVTEEPWESFSPEAAVIEAEAFSGLSSLRLLKISPRTGSIGEACFKDCAGLAWVSMPENDIAIGADAFAGDDTAVLLCPEGSVATDYAKENQLQYIMVP